MWHSRHFWWLFGAFGTLILAALAVLGTIIVSRVENLFLEEIERTLATRAFLVRASLAERPGWNSRRLQQFIEAIQHETATRVTLIAADGRVLADSEADPQRVTIENHAQRPEVREALASGHGIARRRHSSTVDHEMMYLATRVAPPLNEVAVVRVALPLEHIQDVLSELRGMVWTTAALTGAAAMALAFWLARRRTQPLQELTQGAEQIAAGGYGTKVYVAGRDELGTLARSFNHMSERLDHTFRQLEDDRQQLRAVLSSMVEGVVALDAEQNVLFTNERAGNLLDFDTGPAVGRKLWEIVRLRGLQEIVQRVLSGPETHAQELDLPAARSLLVRAARLTGSAGGVVIVLHDTSELRRLERMRQEFVGNVSHELKTPLAVIKASVETLLDGAVDDLQNRMAFLRQIEEQAERLHALILDLLSLTRIESGTENFEFQPVDVPDLVKTCLDRHQNRAESKAQQLRADEGASSLNAWADLEAVSQILDNLVDNALKYTPDGGAITVRWFGERDQVCLEVEDNGIGIPEQDLPRIFERFYRVDKARSRELGGTGLGLAIVKHLAQAMHGSVTALSKPGQGSTFRVRIPRAEALLRNP